MSHREPYRTRHGTKGKVTKEDEEDDKKERRWDIYLTSPNFYL